MAIRWTEWIGKWVAPRSNPKRMTSMLISRNPFSGVLSGGMSLMSGALRPLNTGELLDRTFSLYRNHYALFLGIVALPHLVLLAYQLIGIAIGPSARGIGAAVFTALWAFGALFVSLLVSATSQAATVIAVSQVHLDRPASVPWILFPGSKARFWGSLASVYLRGYVLSLPASCSSYRGFCY